MERTTERRLPQARCTQPARTVRFDMNLSQNCRLLSIRYKCRMIRLTDEQWKRIRDHFPEENIADGRPGGKPTRTLCWLKASLGILTPEAHGTCLRQGYRINKTVIRTFQ